MELTFSELDNTQPVSTKYWQQPNNVIRQSNNTMYQPNNTMQQPNNVPMQQPNNTMPQPNNTMYQPNNTMPQPNNTMPQPNNTMQQPNNVPMQQQYTQQPKKKKVSFDDILSNMNLTVDSNGVLKHIGRELTPQYLHPQQPLDPSVKNSYIYNKYFKDYQDEYISTPEIKVPKTMEEYKKMVLEERIKQFNQKKRISQIKSTKMNFTNGGNIVASANALRMMSFK